MAGGKENEINAASLKQVRRFVVAIAVLAGICAAGLPAARADDYSDAQSMLLGAPGQSNFVQMGNSLAKGPASYGTSGSANCDTTKGQVCANDAIPSSYGASQLQQYTSSYGGSTNAAALQSDAYQQQLNDKAAAANPNSNSPAQWLYHSANSGRTSRDLGTALGSSAADSLQTMNGGADPAGQPRLLSSLFSGCTSTTDASGKVSQVCGGAVRCLGNACHNPQQESNADFGSFAAATQMINAIHTGMVCAETGKPPSQANTCTPTQVQVVTGYQPDPNNPSCTTTDCMIPVMGPQDVCKETGKPIPVTCNGGPVQDLSGTLANMPATCEVAATAPDLNAYPRNCTPIVFAGAENYCNNYLGSGVGLTNNCCATGANAASGLSLTSLIALSDMIPQAKELKAQLIAQAKDGLSPLTQAASQLADNVTSAVGNVAGQIAGGLSSKLSSSAAGAGMQTQAIGKGVGTEVFDFGSMSSSGGSVPAVDNSLSTIVSNALTQVVGPEAAKQIIQAYDYFNTAMMYYSAAKMIGQLATKCSADELQVGVKKQNRVCATMNTYCAVDALGVCLQETTKSCCYSSVITRILAQQIKQQLNPGAANNGYGPDDNPDCGGFTAQQLGQVDWQRIDLSEWTAMLQQTAYGLPQTGTQVNAVASSPNSAVAYYMPNSGAPLVDQQENVATRSRQLTQNNNLEAVRAVATQTQPKCYMDPSGIPVYAPPTKPVENVVQWTTTHTDFPQSTPLGNCTPTVGQHCVQLYLGYYAFHTINGQMCQTIFSHEGIFKVTHPELIVQAHLNQIIWDDHALIKINGRQVFASSGWFNTPYYGGAGTCELHTAWGGLQIPPGTLGIDQIHIVPVPESQGQDYIDLTGDFTKGGDVPTGLYLQVGGSGEAWALIQIEYNDPPPQIPTNCITPPSPQ